MAEDNVLIVSDPTWSHGIIGIVAAKLLEMIDEIDEIWKKTGGVEKSRVGKPAPKAA